MLESFELELRVTHLALEQLSDKDYLGWLQIF
jgi:hypothetical protein